MGMDQVSLKNKNNNKKLDISGKGLILKNIRGINDQLKKIDDDIKLLSSRIHEIIKKEKDNSPRSVILSKLQEIKAELKVFKDERSALHNENDIIKKKIDELRANSDTGAGIMTEEQIDQRIEQLNVNLIRKTHTATEEKQIASELSALSAKKEKLGDVKENLKTLKNLEVRFKEIKGQIAKLNKEIGTRTDKSNEYKTELDKLHEESKKKHPQIDQLNEKIKMLKEQKTNLYTLREEKEENYMLWRLSIKSWKRKFYLQRKMKTVKIKLRMKFYC